MTMTRGGQYDALYARSGEQPLWGASPGRLVARIGEWLAPGSSVLDAGCGDGKNAIFMERSGYRVHGFDRSALAVRSLERRFRCAAIPPRGQYGVADAALYQPPAAAFDGLVSYGLYHCLAPPSRSQVHRRLQRGVRIGGFVLFTTLLDSRPLPEDHETPGIALTQHAELSALFDDAWEQIDVTYGEICERHAGGPEHQHDAVWIVARRLK
jgi:SAM-dependent methyltransferase